MIANDGRVICGEFDVWTCSLAPGHDGDHIAHTNHDLDGSILDEWNGSILYITPVVGDFLKRPDDVIRAPGEDRWEVVDVSPDGTATLKPTTTTANVTLLAKLQVTLYGHLILHPNGSRVRIRWASSPVSKSVTTSDIPDWA